MVSYAAAMPGSSRHLTPKVISPVTAAWWGIAVVILTAILQALAAFVVLRLYTAQVIPFADRESASGFAQGVIGVIVLWFALGLRPEQSTRTRALLSLLGLVPLWGTLVAVAVQLVLERRQAQEPPTHL